MLGRIQTALSGKSRQIRQYISDKSKLLHFYKVIQLNTNIVFHGETKTADENGEMKVIPAEKSNMQQQNNGQFVNMSVNLKQASSAAGSGFWDLSLTLLIWIIQILTNMGTSSGGMKTFKMFEIYN